MIALAASGKLAEITNGPITKKLLNLRSYEVKICKIHLRSYRKY
jgi:hypothetical protein